jgi:hypothetical protein
MNSVRISSCRFDLSARPPAGYVPRIRDFFGQPCDQEVRKHLYDADGRPLYEYPRIQFKVIDSTALLMGIAEGADLLQRLWPTIDVNQLGDEQLQVVDAEFETREAEIAPSPKPVEYRFVTPWLALNQRNFRAYVDSFSTKFRKDELSRILVGNCLGLAKSFGIRFPERIDADGRHLTSIKITLDGQGMIGFVGKFQVNLKLPEYLGLGKSVWRGFGTIAETAG